MKRSTLALIVGIGLIGVAIWIGRSFTSSEDATKPPPGIAAPAGPKPLGTSELVPEEEREKYIADFVTTSSVTIGSDEAVDVNGAAKKVAGLLRVHGKVKNSGDRKVRPVRLSLQIFDASDKVIGSYFEDVTAGGPLNPGEERDFKFTIPEKKEFAGKFQQKLR